MPHCHSEMTEMAQFGNTDVISATERKERSGRYPYSCCKHLILNGFLDHNEIQPHS
jgi:hypothetical protein